MGTFNKNLADLTNPRLQRLSEKIAAYGFKVTYVPGITHNIAEALSRAPIFSGTDKLNIQIDMALAYLIATRDPALNIVHEAIDQDYQQCMADIIEDTVISRLSQLKSVKGDISLKDGLILLDSRRVILPIPAIKPILARLHIGHAGQEKTITLANQLYF